MVFVLMGYFDFIRSLILLSSDSTAKITASLYLSPRNTLLFTYGSLLYGSKTFYSVEMDYTFPSYTAFHEKPHDTSNILVQLDVLQYHAGQVSNEI